MVVKIEIDLIDEEDVDTLFELIDLVFTSAQERLDSSDRGDED